MIKTYSTLQIGSFHTNYCEDFCITAPIATNQLLIAVMDGCTMGTESAFASMLFGKCLRNIARKRYYQEFFLKYKEDIHSTLKRALEELFIEIKLMKNQLGLETHELLSTLIMGIIDTEMQTAELITIGDGFVCCDGQVTEYDQADKPDYLAYHLGKPFETWYKEQTQRLSIRSFHDLAISTDGISSFRNFKAPSAQKSESEIIDFLLVNDRFSEHNNLLDRKLRFIGKEWQYEVTDDLAIVRVIVKDSLLEKT